MNTIYYVALAIAAYLLGSIPFSYLLPKWINNVDIRLHGSGNAGTTNVFRNLGLKSAIIAFLGDFLKGFIPTFLGFSLLGTTGAVIGGGFAIIGHCYSFALKFKGGKGIATAAGVILAISPLTFLIVVVCQFGIIFSTKLMSLASISSAVIFPLSFFLLGMPKDLLIFSICVGIFVLYRHKPNIIRLINKEEKQLDLKSKGKLNK